MLGLAADTEAVMAEHLRQRIRAMLETNRVEGAKHGITNAVGEPILPAPDDALVDAVYRLLVVHPAFGLGWDEVPPPNLKGTEAMKAIDAYIATNGWNVWSSNVLLFALRCPEEKPLAGLPWKEIRDRSFRAFTCRGILYVPWSVFGADCVGVAYNPNTNRFPAIINKFKHLGDHWYAWTQTQSPPGLQRYEGQSP